MLGAGQVVITSSKERRVSFDLIDFYRNRCHLLGVNTMALGGVATAAILEELRPGFDEGRLTPPELTLWPFDRAIEAYRRPAPRRIRGRSTCSVLASSSVEEEGAMTRRQWDASNPSASLVVHALRFLAEHGEEGRRSDALRAEPWPGPRRVHGHGVGQEGGRADARGTEGRGGGLAGMDCARRGVGRESFWGGSRGRERGTMREPEVETA